MKENPCAACGRVFQVLPNVPRQKYCTHPDCQKARKRRWQAGKMVMDPDYQINQKAAQAQWRKNHPEYWREYRKRNPEYACCNRCRQRVRNRARKAKNRQD